MQRSAGTPSSRSSLARPRCRGRAAGVRFAGRATRWLGLGFLLWALCAPVEAADADYLSSLTAQARALGLARSAQWQALGLYAPDMLGGGRSGMVDNPAFYLAANGKTDAEAELLATLAAFFAPPTAVPDEHPQCRKIARYHWLKGQLHFDPQQLPPQPCPAFRDWITEINPGQITLIFPAAYLNNPSSMFGHTLIRIDPPGQKEGVRLNSYAVNFAADYGGERGALFALKGLAGGYQGYLSLLHYYDKVAQYSDFENRDIWEYELAFTPEESTLILETVWELDKQPIDYYFFTTNCSFVLLALLNVGRPQQQWLDRFSAYAVPVDTVRAVLETEGLLRRVVFRPSTRSRIRAAANELSKKQQALALRLSAGELDADAREIQALPVPERARVLELAQSHLQYRLITGAVAGDAAKARSMRLLRARAALGTTGPAPAGTEGPPPTRPDQGHASERLSFAAGISGRRPFGDLAFRGVYHDLLDPPDGFVDGAAITLGELGVRLFADDPPILQSLTVLAIKSLSARDPFFQPISWQTRVGVDRLREDGDDAGELAFGVSAGAGPAWALGDAAIVSSQFAATLYADEHWPADRIVGVGPTLDFVWSARPWWRWQAEAGAAFVAGSEDRALFFHGSVGQGFRLDRNLSLRLTAGVRNDGGETFGEWTSTLTCYF